MRGLSPDQLRTFIEVVELGSFTAAAKRLNLSQPAVSLQIRELESRCGVQLLQRDGRKPYATDAGRKLLVHAQRILKENEEALAAMRNLRDATGQLVRLGMTMTTLSYLARDVVRRFKHDNPKIDLSVILSASHALADDVRNHNLDLAIVSLPIDETSLAVRRFFQDNVIGIVTDGNFVPTPKAATPQMLAGTPFVIQTIGDVQMVLAQNWFRASGLAPHSFVEVGTLDACRAAVAAGLGVSIVPGLMAQQPMRGLIELPLDPPIVRQMAIIEHKDRKQNPNVERLRAALLSCGNLANGDAGVTVAKLETHRRARH